MKQFSLSVYNKINNHVLEEDGFVCVQIPNDLYRQIEQWRLELCETYSLSEMGTNEFISLLIKRAQVDVSVLLWHLEEGVVAFKD